MDNFGNVPVLEVQTRECPYVPEVSLGTRTNPRMSLINRSTMRVLGSRDKPEESRDKTRDRISPPLEREI